MGFFSFLECLSTPTYALFSRIAISSSATPTSTTDAEHNVSLPLITTHQQRNTSSTSTPAIPMEIVLCIIEAAFYDNHEPDENLLKNCTLVCRAWSGLAQQLLFSRVTLRTQVACDSFRAAVDRSTERGRMLGDAVTRMRVVVDHNQPYGILQRSFGQTFVLCPNLYELNLALYGCAAPGADLVGLPDVSRMRRPAPSFDDETLSLLRSGPRITALQFSNWSENQQTIVQLLDVWPTLKSLDISGTVPQAPVDAVQPFACSLEELRMNFQLSPSAEFMNWLLHNSLGTLRIIDFEREPSPHLLEYLIKAHGSTLYSLSLPSLHEKSFPLQDCSHLKEFLMESPTVSHHTYKKLPETLEHIAIGLDRNSTVQPVLEAVRSSDCLKMVTLNIWDGGELHPLYPAFKMACASRGVELRITKDIQEFRDITRGDPIPHQSFPRTTSLDNLRFMRFNI